MSGEMMFQRKSVIAISARVRLVFGVCALVGREGVFLRTSEVALRTRVGTFTCEENIESFKVQVKTLFFIDTAGFKKKAFRYE